MNRNILRAFISSALCASVIASMSLDAFAATDPNSFDILGVRLGMTVDQAFSSMKARESYVPGATTADPIIYYSDCRTGTIRTDSEKERSSIASGSSSMKEEIARINDFCVKVIEIKTALATFESYLTPGASNVRSQVVTSVQLIQTLAGKEIPRGNALPANAYFFEAETKYGSPTMHHVFSTRPNSSIPGFGNAVWCPDGVTVAVCVKGFFAYEKSYKDGLLQLPSVSASPISFLVATVKGTTNGSGELEAFLALIALPGGHDAGPDAPEPSTESTLQN